MFPHYPKLLLFTALTLLTAAPASAQQEINDVNTPLHLMKPSYDTPYSIPTKEGVKAKMDQVLSFLETAMPAETDGDNLKQGSLRLTSYEIGVLYAASADAGISTGDSRYSHFAADRLSLIAETAQRIKSKVEKNPAAYPQLRKVCVPGALDDAGAMCSAYIRWILNSKVKASKDVDAVIRNYFTYVHDKQYRLKDGIFARIRPHYNTVWLDDMYMGVPCLAWYGAYLKQNEKTLAEGDRYISEAVEQIHLFKDRMWVPEKKLFRHGWVEEMNPHPAFHWGRANGWAILTMCEVLDAIGNDASGSHATERAFVLDLLRQHIEGLCQLQDKTGLWHQLLDRPDTYLETSATAIYTYCIAHAICEGWIDAEAYGAQTLLAWNAVASKINAKGQVEGTCVGSGMGFDAAFYSYRPVHVMAAHGYGPAVWAGSEVIRLLGATHPKMNDSAIHFYPTEQTTSEPIFSEKRTGVADEKVIW